MTAPDAAGWRAIAGELAAVVEEVYRGEHKTSWPYRRDLLTRYREAVAEEEGKSDAAD